MVACVIEELSFKRKVKVVSASVEALNPLMDKLKRSVPPPHIIPVAMVLFKVILSVLGYILLSFAGIFVALNLFEVIVSTIALLAVIEPFDVIEPTIKFSAVKSPANTISPVISTMKGIKLASSIIISPSLTV